MKKEYKKSKKPRAKKSAMSPMGIKGMSPEYSTVLVSTTQPEYFSTITTETTFTKVFEISECLNFSNYAMFDQYRLNWVEVKLVPVGATVVTQDPDVTGSYTKQTAAPNYVVYVDRDDITTSGTYDSLRVRKGATTRIATKGWSRKFRPNVLSNIYNGALPDAYKIVTDPAWIDSANTVCPHYGLKFAMQNGGVSDGQYGLKLQIRSCYSFTNRRT